MESKTRRLKMHWKNGMIEQDKQNLSVWLGLQIGGKLDSVFGLFYSDGGLVDIHDAPNEIELVFIGNSGTFFCCSDGMSICFEPRSAAPLSMGKAGSFLVKDISDQEPYKRIISSDLSRAFLVESKREEAIIGFKLEFSEHVLSVLNLGDDLKTFGLIPDWLKKEEALDLHIISETGR